MDKTIKGLLALRTLKALVSDGKKGVSISRIQMKMKTNFLDSRDILETLVASESVLRIDGKCELAPEFCITE